MMWQAQHYVMIFAGILINGKCAEVTGRQSAVSPSCRGAWLPWGGQPSLHLRGRSGTAGLAWSGFSCRQAAEAAFHSGYAVCSRMPAHTPLSAESHAGDHWSAISLSGCEWSVGLHQKQAAQHCLVAFFSLLVADEPQVIAQVRVPTEA